MSERAPGRIVEGLAGDLQVTREQLEAILGDVDEGVTVVGGDGRFLYANDGAARLLGLASPAELLDLDVDSAREPFAIFDDDGEPLAPQELPGRRAFSGEATDELVVRFRPAGGGEERISVVRAVPILDGAGSVQAVVSFFREITDERRRAARQAFIAEAGAVLGSSLDYEATLRMIADLAVPRLADWCVVDLLADDGTLRRFATAHADPDKARLSAELHRRWPPRLDHTSTAGRVIVARRGELVAEVTDDLLAEIAHDEEHLRLLRVFAPASVLAVPIEVRGDILGAVSLGLTTTHRRFDEDDLELAQDVAYRAGIAIDNARLFTETQHSEALLDTIFETAPVGLGFWDRDLRFVRVNEALARINAFPAEEHVGKRLDELLPELDQDVIGLYRRVLETGEPVLGAESVGHTRAEPGVRRTWLQSYYPIRDLDGETIGVGAVVSDVTEARRAQQRLLVQHAVTRALAEADTIEDVMPRVLDAVCELLEWDVGAYWTIAPGGDEMVCDVVRAGESLEAFAAVTKGHRVRRGISLAGEIWEHAAPLWSGDLPERDDFPQAAEAAAAGILTGFGFPVIAGGAVVGILEFFGQEERAPDEELLEVVGALGRNVGQFVRRTRAEAERLRLLVAERRARADAEAAASTLRKLAEVSEAALAHLSLRDLLEALLERTKRVLDADTAAILLVDGNDRTVSLRAAVGFHDEVTQAVPVPFGQGLAGRVAETREPALVDHLDEVELVSPVLHARGIHSLVAIPLIVEDDVIGVLHAGSEQPQHFTVEDVRLLELIADRVALAINQTALYEAEREAQERLSFLADASTVLAGSLEYEETLGRVAELVVPRLADWCSIDVLEAKGAIKRVAVAHADPEKARWAWELSERFPPDPDDPNPGSVPYVLRTGEPFVMPEIPQELIEEALELAPDLREPVLELQLRSAMIVPLVARGRTLGAITFVWAESGKSYAESDLSYAQELAARAAVAVDNARLYRAAETGRERLLFLAEASALLGSALHPEEAMRELADLVVGRIADWSSIHVVDDAGVPRLVTVAHPDPEKAAAARAFAESLDPDPGSAHGVYNVVRTGEPELIPVVPTEFLAGPVAEAGVHSVMIVPLVARGRTLGALSLVWAETDRTYDESDLEFAADLGRRAAVAIDNAQLYRQAEERAQAAHVLASVGDGVMLVDSAGIVRYWNRAAAAITGLLGDEIVDRNLAEVVPAWPLVKDRVPVAAHPTGTMRAESIPLAVHGRELWLSISGVAVADGTVYAFRDLTEERALDEMKTEFVSTVSHELRTPLAAIYGAAMTLRRSDVELDEEQGERLLGVISSEADRLARTVNDILWASRLDTDTLKVRIESCDPLRLTHDVVEAQRTHLVSGIDLEIVSPDGLPAVAADPDKVRQVLVNLVDNAVKYSPDGGRVEVRLDPVGAQVRFTVTDEGLGIPFAEQRRIFEKFYRLDPNMTRGIGGTGLGLYICRELVRRMHGRIWVTSEPGRGSTFALELPVAGAELDVAAHAVRRR